MSEQHDWHTRLEAFEKGLSHTDQPFFMGMANGSMTVELFRPKDVDTQQPHEQDELYIIRRGTGSFERDGTRVEVAEGDVIFVPAGMDHRFEQFSEDFDTWVIFWGPKGGEN